MAESPEQLADEKIVSKDPRPNSVSTGARIRTVMNPDSYKGGRRPRVAVVGSLNVDYIWNVLELPRAGQTVLAQEGRTEFGGKGANQAVAATRHGAEVFFIGCVGDDADGESYCRYLKNIGVQTAEIRRITGVATGAAHIYVDSRGENMIVVSGGANERLDHNQVFGSLAGCLDGADALVAQLESPIAAVEAALQMAHAKGVRSVLNASPFHAQFTWRVPVDTVIVNEHELEDFFGVIAVSLMQMQPERRIELLARHQIQNLVITQGSEPTLHVSANEVHSVPTHRVVPKNTVGAGDTFAGSLAVCLAHGMDWQAALWQANVAAGLSTLFEGVQTAIPTLAEVLKIVNPPCSST